MTGRIATRVAGRWLVLSLIVFMLNQASINMIRPMVAYRALALGLGPASLGLLSASFSITPLLLALRMGRMIDRRGSTIFIAVGTVALIVAGFGLALVSTPESAWMLFVLFALLGLGEITTGVATQAMIARHGDERTYDRGFAAFSFFASIGQMAGPAMAALVAGGGSPDEVTRTMVIGAAIGVLILPLLLLIRPPATTAQAVEPAGHPLDTTLLGILRTPGIFRAILVGTTVLSSIDIVVMYLPALGQERLWAASLVGSLLAVRAGASMAVRVVLGSLAARLGRPVLLVASMAVSAVALLALPFLTPLPLVVLAMVAAGAGLGIGQPLSLAWVASAAPRPARATALAIRIMGNGVGRIALPVVAGTLAAVAGAAGVLVATAGVMALSLAAVFGGLTGQSAPPGAPPAHAPDDRA